ncbi:sucrase ferredoxin [Williamsia phyllosphaerae]|nr:sucrase ferredoxin [Williamsia phyllosphaerae]
MTLPSDGAPPQRPTVLPIPPCSDQSLARDEPLFATASLGFAWLLLEMEGPWGHSAFMQSPRILDRDLGRAIVRRAEAASMRIVAIRRPGRRSATPRWRWFIAQTRPQGSVLYQGEVAGPQDYLDIPLDGSAGVRVDGPLTAVCAHGKHDRCCAVRGRGAAAALVAHDPENTWECSHLGGDRFAATMVVLPEGLSYGRIDTADPVDLLTRYADGRVHERFLRGRTCVSHAVQAAEHYLRDATGDDRIEAFTTLDVEEAGDRVRVSLAVAQGSRCTVSLRVVMSEPLLSTCDARIPGSVRRFELESLDFDDPA